MIPVLELWPISPPEVPKAFTVPVAEQYSIMLELSPMSEPVLYACSVFMFATDLQCVIVEPVAEPAIPPTSLHVPISEPVTLQFVTEQSVSRPARMPTCERPFIEVQFTFRFFICASSTSPKRAMKFVEG